MVKMSFDGIFLGATKTDYVRKSDNKESCFFNVSVKQGGAVETLPCQESIFKAYDMQVIKDFQPCKFTVTYDSRFGRLSVIDAVGIKQS